MRHVETNSQGLTWLEWLSAAPKMTAKQLSNYGWSEAKDAWQAGVQPATFKFEE
jgi:hypothetical protein